MKSTNKFFVLLACAALLLSTVSISVAAQADEDYYGTEAEGMYIKSYQVNKTTPHEGVINWDFSQGFKYWGGLGGKKVLDVAQLVTEGSVRCVRLTGEEQWNGITTPLIVTEDLKVGQQACIVYDWKGKEEDFQVYLSQWIPTEGGSLTESRMGLMNGTTLHKAENENEWNTSVTRITELVKASDSGDENIYIAAAAQLATENPSEANVRIANLRLCIMNVKSGRIYDTDGNLIKSDTYEYIEDKEDYEEALEGFEDYYKRLNAEKLRQEAAKKQQTSEKTEVSVESNTEAEQRSTGNAKTVIFVACIAVIVLAVAAVTVTAVSLKKQPVKGNEKSSKK